MPTSPGESARTLPSSRTAIARRPSPGRATRLHVPDAGSYRSTDPTTSGTSPQQYPAVTSTPPSSRSQAACDQRASLRLPLRAHALRPGSKSSDVSSARPYPTTPPATSTRPSSRRVAVCASRPSPVLGTADHVPAEGSKISAERLTPYPPTTSTRPSARSVSVWPLRRGCVIVAVVQLPDAGSKSSERGSSVPPTTSTPPSASVVAVGLAR